LNADVTNLYRNKMTLIHQLRSLQANKNKSRIMGVVSCRIYSNLNF